MRPGVPSNLELFVVQRVSAELQPLLDRWRDAVRGELLAVREASADAAEWREAVSSELSTLRAGQQRTADTLATASARLEEAPPSQLHRSLEKQEESFGSSMRRLQEALGETSLTFERAEASSAKDKRQVIKAIQEERARALEASGKQVEHLELHAADLAARLSAAEAAAKASGKRAANVEQQLTHLRIATSDTAATQDALRRAEARVEEGDVARRAAEATATQQAVHCSLLGEALVAAERDWHAAEHAALADAHEAVGAILGAVRSHEERRRRSHAEWLAATEAVVPTIASSAHALVGRLEAAAERADGTSSALDGWRGRATIAEARAAEADGLRRAAEVRAADAETLATARAAECVVLALQARTLVAELRATEVEIDDMRRRDAAAVAAAAECADAVAPLSAVHAAVCQLAADMLVPMRALELEATATALEDADTLRRHADAAACAEAAGHLALQRAEGAWRVEREALSHSRDAAAEDARASAASAAALRHELAQSEVRVAVLDERLGALDRQLLEAAHAEAAAVRSHLERIASVEADVARERESAVTERSRHAQERAELARMVEQARLAAAAAADEAATAVARAADESRRGVEAERAAGEARVAAADEAAEASRAALDRYRSEAEAAQRRSEEAHAAQLATAAARTAELAASFKLELEKQRERSEVAVLEAKASASAQHEVALRAAAEREGAAEARVEAAQAAAKVAAEQHQQQLRALTREHAAALRAERQLASQELAAARERAEDAERRLEMMRHADYLHRAAGDHGGGGHGGGSGTGGFGGCGCGGGGLSAASLGGGSGLGSGGRGSDGACCAAGRTAGAASVGGGGVDGGIGMDDWEGLRQRQEANAQRLADLASGRRGTVATPAASRHTPGRGSWLAGGASGASAALLRRAMLAEASTPRTADGGGF